MRAGLLNTPVQVYAPTETPDTLGQIVTAYDLWGGGVMWADVRYATGLSGVDVRLDAQSPNSNAGSCSVRVRQSTCALTVGRKHRLAFDGQQFEILDIRPQGRGLMDFVCRPVAAL